MAIQLPNGRNYFEATGGGPAVGYKLYAFVPNTSTPKDTYTTYLGNVANTHPVVMDARGEAAIYWSGTYDVILKTDADVTVWGPERLDTASFSNDLADTTDVTKGDALVGVKREATGSVGMTLHDWIEAQPINIEEFGITADGVTDDKAQCQLALDSASGPVVFPPGVYALSGELVIPDGGGIIGASAHWKRRTAYVYDGAEQTVFKYIGAGGTNSCVIRASQVAVATQATDFAGAETDDLVNITLRDFHVDANNLAEIGVYVYRAGNQATINNLTAEKAKKYNHVHLGCYAARFGTFGAYESEEHGVAIGWDIFSWGTAESTCFAYEARFMLANNGTDSTYVAGGAFDLDGTGGRFLVGRGSEIEITSESNDGRACILSQYNSANTTMGTTDYVLEYIEGNADGPYIDYRDAMDSLRIMNGFLHPGNGSSLLPQGIKIDGKNNSGVTTADSGPARMEEWLTFYRVFGDLSAVGVAINSNTFKYRLIECTPWFTFSATRPGAYAFNLALEGATTPGTQTYTLRSGFSARYGNLVIVTGRVTLSALDGATAGQIRITGFPYRISGQTNLFGVACVTAWSGLTTSVIALNGTLTNGTSYIAFTRHTAAATSSIANNLVPADLSNTTLIQFTASYITDDS